MTATSNPCATCGACCRSYIVPVCGQDIWRISHRQRLDPEHFLIPVPQPQPRSDGFRSQPGAWTYALMLDKQGRLKVDQSCVFLVHLVGGHDRCGIYDHRPVVCQAYPMVMAPRGVTLRDASLCPPESWPDEELRSVRGARCCGSPCSLTCTPKSLRAGMRGSTHARHDQVSSRSRNT